jgi:alkylation response protein AidB-like acyl-CoA dehydrogenase
MNAHRQRITSPSDPALSELCQQLSALSPTLAEKGWPAEQLQLCGEFGVFEWFISESCGGQGWSEADVMRGYLALSQACLTTTFVITQRTGGCHRIEASENRALVERLLPDLIRGTSLTTVGISHLTTSRQHLSKPVLRAARTDGGFVLDGFCPWVTGSTHADTVVLGATMEDGRQILVVVPTDATGVEIPAAARLVGLSASQTGPFHCHQVAVADELLLAGPAFDIMKQGVGANTGGVQTSALANGLAVAAIEFLENEAEKRTQLDLPAESLRRECDQLTVDMLNAAANRPTCSNEVLRTRANSLALRASQAALAAAKGTGYVAGHPVGRWCCEALFFLVWSCPQTVMEANLCELAGISQ